MIRFIDAASAARTVSPLGLPPTCAFVVTRLYRPSPSVAGGRLGLGDAQCEALGVMIPAIIKIGIHGYPRLGLATQFLKAATAAPIDMARRKNRLYKTVNVQLKDMGSSGASILLGYVKKIDAEGVSGYLNNMVVSSYITDYEQPAGAIAGNVNPPPSILYSLQTTSASSGDDYITARATTGAGTVSLSAKRQIARNDPVDDGNDGQIYLWAELTDTTVTNNVSCKFVIETWGRFVEFVES